MTDTVTSEYPPEASPVPEVLGDGGRYRVVRRLGQGAFGTVFEAVDTRYGAPVAIKALRGRAVPALYRFKQEFRSLADLDHPNLIRLYELSSEGWFVVMERVDGVDLLAHLHGRSDALNATADQDVPPRFDPDTDRAPPPLDLEATRDAFRQLSRGLSALHAARKLHCDIKPSNVMVDRAGRVVLLDFGLVAEEDREADGLRERGIGTPAYMAPEQAAGETMTAACDWYAVGATLHAALTGHPPRPRSTLLDGSASTPLDADDLTDLCRRLLHADPTQRPGGTEVLAALGAVPSDVREARRSVALTVTLIGRDAELAALDEALDAARLAPRMVRVVGTSGVGKTALLDGWFTRAAARRPELWVLRCRCLEHEYIPFKAIDGIVDALVVRLLTMPDDARRTLLPADPAVAEPLRQMFPVFARLFDAETAGERGGWARLTDPRTLRDQALVGLRETIGRVAERFALVLCIDDAHWGDVDSARALGELLRPQGAGLLLIVAQRPSDDADALPAALAEWLSHAPTTTAPRDLMLSALAAHDALALARSCLGDTGPDAASLAERVASAAGGSPFIIRHVAGEVVTTRGADAATTSPSELIARQLARASTPVQRLVHILSLAARPLPEDVAARAAGLDPSELRPLMHAAERSRLVVGSRHGGARHVEAVHARIREEVARSLDAVTTRACHRKIADSFVVYGQREPEILLPHLLGADDRPGASAAAAQLAERAERAFAFERAAELYGIILGLDPALAARASLLERRGDALAHAGRSPEAAAALEASLQARFVERPADLPEDERRALRRLRRRCGELWLRSGHISKGTGHLRAVLDDLGIAMPTSENQAIRTSMWRRVRLLVRGLEFTPRAEREVPVATLERLDALWGVTTSLVMLKFLIADAVGLQHLHEALSAGEPTRVLRALALEVSFESLLGGSFFDRRCERMLAQMDHLAEGFDTPYFRAWSAMCRGVAGWMHGDWQIAWDACRTAAKTYAAQSRGLVWELSVCDVYGLSAATYLGRFSELAAVVPESHRAARERGDLYAAANLAFYESALLLTRDEPEAAIRCAEDSVKPFLDDELLANRYGITYAMAQGELYRGRPEAAWALIERDWSAWETTGMLRVQCVRVEVRYLRARVSLAALARGGATLSRPPRAEPAAPSPTTSARSAARRSPRRAPSPSPSAPQPH